MSIRLARIAGSILVAAATAVVIVALAVVPFLNPVWIAFEQDRAQATAWTGYDRAELRAATDAILADLVLGPPDFDVVVDGQPVLNPRERGHMEDVRGVFGGLALVAVLAVAVLVAARLGSGGGPGFWRAVRAGAVALLVGTAVVGLVGILAFDLAFDVFHRLFFIGGNYTFDPRTDRLVQLFPMTFWFETSIAVGVVLLLLAAVVTVLASRAARRPAVATRGTERADGEPARLAPDETSPAR